MPPQMDYWIALCETVLRYPAEVSVDWIVDYIAEMNDWDDPYEGDVPNHVQGFAAYTFRYMQITDIEHGDHDYDRSLVADYANRPGASAPPIVYDAIHHEIIDGFHRYRAAVLRGDKHIAAYVGINPTR